LYDVVFEDVKGLPASMSLYLLYASVFRVWGMKVCVMQAIQLLLFIISIYHSSNIQNKATYDTTSAIYRVTMLYQCLVSVIYIVTVVVCPT